MSSSYILIDEKTNQIKADAKTGMFCIFDTQKEAERVKRSYDGKASVSLVKCDISFSNIVYL